MLKTISKAEFIFFRKIIRNYYQYVSAQPQTLLTRFFFKCHIKMIFKSLLRIYGLHKMKISKTKSKFQKLYFVVMSNLFATSIQIDLRYDLKGENIKKIFKKIQFFTKLIFIIKRLLLWQKDKRIK